jgi:hypothetical protein
MCFRHSADGFERFQMRLLYPGIPESLQVRASARRRLHRIEEKMSYLRHCRETGVSGRGRKRSPFRQPVFISMCFDV